MSDKQWFMESFDGYVAGEGDSGAVLDKSRDAVAHQYADGVESGVIDRPETDLVQEGRDRFDRFVVPLRERRKSQMKRSARELLEALSDGTILGLDDPRLAQAFPTGDGRDKTLSLWTVGDWETARTERYRNAASVTSAARDFDLDAQQFIDLINSRGVRTTGDLFEFAE